MPPPRLMLTAAMWYWSARSKTRSSPLTSSLIQAPTPKKPDEKTWMEMMSASRATPKLLTPSLAAAMPATCVPCSQPKSEQLIPEPGAVDSHTPPGQTDVEEPGTFEE